jgi:hypothetical protein
MSKDIVILLTDILFRAREPLNAQLPRVVPKIENTESEQNPNKQRIQEVSKSYFNFEKIKKENIEYIKNKTKEWIENSKYSKINPIAYSVLENIKNQEIIFSPFYSYFYNNDEINQNQNQNQNQNCSCKKKQSLKKVSIMNEEKNINEQSKPLCFSYIIDSNMTNNKAFILFGISSFSLGIITTEVIRFFLNRK